MKKSIIFILFALSILLLVGCGSSKQEGVLAFSGTIVELNDTSAVVQLDDGDELLNSADRISFDIARLEDIDAKLGDRVKVEYNGAVMETYPAQINAVSWSLMEKGADEVQYARIPMVQVEGRRYYDTGNESTIDGRCGNMDGEITSSVDGTEIPTENDQSNFGTDYGYQRISEDIIEVNINNKWIVFEYRGGDGSTIRYGDSWYDVSKLSEDTITWLQWYNGLTKEEQNAVSAVPEELIDYGSISTENAE